MKHGVDFTINDQNMLDFIGDIKAPRPAIRRFRDAANILYPYQKPEPKPDKSPFIICTAQYIKMMRTRRCSKMRVSGMISRLYCRGYMGEEFIKTVGHFHPKKRALMIHTPSITRFFMERPCICFKKTLPMEMWRKYLS